MVRHDYSLQLNQLELELDGAKTISAEKSLMVRKKVFFKQVKGAVHMHKKKAKKIRLKSYNLVHAIVDSLELGETQKVTLCQDNRIY